jgi:hypothetical protein
VDWVIKEDCEYMGESRVDFMLERVAGKNCRPAEAY